MALGQLGCVVLATRNTNFRITIRRTLSLTLRRLLTRMARPWGPQRRPPRLLKVSEYIYMYILGVGPPQYCGGVQLVLM